MRILVGATHFLRHTPSKGIEGKNSSRTRRPGANRLERLRRCACQAPRKDTAIDSTHERANATLFVSRRFGAPESYQVASGMHSSRTYKSLIRRSDQRLWAPRFDRAVPFLPLRETNRHGRLMTQSESYVSSGFYFDWLTVQNHRLKDPLDHGIDCKSGKARIAGQDFDLFYFTLWVYQ